MKIKNKEELNNRDNSIVFWLNGYKYENNEIRKITGDENSKAIAYGQPTSINKIDYGLPQLTGKPDDFEIEWSKVTYTQKGREGKTNTLRKSFRGTKKQIITQMLNDNIFYNDNDCKNYINKLLAVYGDDIRMINTIKERKLILKPYTPKYETNEFKWFIEWTKTWPEQLQYTFGTYFIIGHFWQYFINNNYLIGDDDIKMPILNGDSKTAKTLIMVLIILPSLTEEQLTIFTGNLSKMVIPIPSTYASIRDSLAYPNRIVGLDEIHNQLDNGYRFHPDIHSLFLNFGTGYLPSKKDEDGNNTQERWTAYPLLAFNDPIELDTQSRRRFDLIPFSQNNWSPKETLKEVFPEGIIPKEASVNAMNNLLEAVAEQIFNYPDRFFNIQKIKEYVWSNLGAPWLAEAQNPLESEYNTKETEIDMQAKVRSYLSVYINFNPNPMRNDASVNSQIIDYFRNQGIIIENNEGYYFIRRKPFVKWFKGRVMKNDTGFSSKEAWETLVEIFNINENTYKLNRKIKGKQVSTTYEVPEEFTDNLE